MVLRKSGSILRLVPSCAFAVVIAAGTAAAYKIGIMMHAQVLRLIAERIRRSGNVATVVTVIRGLIVHVAVVVFAGPSVAHKVWIMVHVRVLRLLAERTRWSGFAATVFRGLVVMLKPRRGSVLHSVLHVSTHAAWRGQRGIVFLMVLERVSEGSLQVVHHSHRGLPCHTRACAAPGSAVDVELINRREGQMKYRARTSGC